MQATMVFRRIYSSKAVKGLSALTIINTVLNKENTVFSFYEIYFL